ncbi:unnamed protein product [Symbiodinium natans]|uniref:Uncharacterized protein n=1 Tax=Symbiodinium natans TaxID=878477 RepID=A0A812G8T7_9DINO|nr:unnamed protein product [Symbiodinium natans]
MPRTQEIPSQLSFTSRAGQQKLGGLYQLIEGQISNGFPVWKRVGVGEQAWIYSGPNKKWYVSCNKVVEESEFQCGRGLVSSIDEHRGLLPNMLEEHSWQYKDSRGWNKDLSIRFVLPSSPAPETIYVTSPHGHQKLSGEYRHSDGQLANGYPFWKRAGYGEEAYLYSGRYVVSRNLAIERPTAAYLRRGFARQKRGKVAVLKHPLAGTVQTVDLVLTGWGIKTSEGWQQDDDIRSLTGNHCDSLHVLLPVTRVAELFPIRNNHHTIRAATCAALGDITAQGMLANGHPVWKRSGAGAVAWLYSGTNGRWCIAGHEVASQKFRCSLAQMRSHPHFGSMPHRQTSWLLQDEDAWCEDEEIRLGTSPPTAAADVYLSTPNAEQKKAGRYQLVQGMLVHGYPTIWVGGSSGEKILYTGSDGRWYVGSSTEVTQRSYDCTLGRVSSADPHGGVMPLQLFDDAWQYKAEQGWCLDADICFSAEPAEAVVQLYVASHNTHSHVSGIYSLVSGHVANDQPLWKREGTGEELWLYGGTDGKWRVADRQAYEKNFVGEDGFICSSPHGGVMPDMLPGRWHGFVNAREGYLPDPDIAVVTRLPDYPLELTLLMPSGQQKLAGKYQMVSGCAANGQCIWKRVGAGEEAWLYSGNTGSIGNVASAYPHGGMLPCYETRGWKVKDAEGWKAASDARVLRGSLASAFPPVLHVVCSPAQLGKSGVQLGSSMPWIRDGAGDWYQLLWDEYLNGQPVWGRAEPGESSLLYSSCDGFWCISRQVCERHSKCCMGSVASLLPHGGSMPHLCYEGWQVKRESGWDADSSLMVQTNPPEGPTVLHVSCESREHVSGKYWLVQGEFRNHRHVWKRAGSSDGPWISSGSDGSWFLTSTAPTAPTASTPSTALGPLEVTSLRGDSYVTGEYFPVEGRAECLWPNAAKQ